MKIYMVSYMGMDDNSYSEYYSDKATATKRHNVLKESEDKILDDFVEDDPAECKMVYSIINIDCEISKAGILKMLNSIFHQNC